ncbi:uncharacterized protein LOC121416913 isoform X2 [Lytechinus variegatus]|uniref:uncharacterized protein LOC121416913 isoform X2 n=1 Tax=Lytechinus variegatus TaxID=7654 RepID=UPI001BB25F49|nr:uncharacterized protein LOC121416913 isoform X2 [Lytechinus variegatus]
MSYQVSKMSHKVIVCVCLLVTLVSITSSRVVDINGDEEAIDQTALDLVNDGSPAHIPRVVRRSAGDKKKRGCCFACYPWCTCCYA